MLTCMGSKDYECRVLHFRIQTTTGARLFTSSGTQYYHMFNFSLCANDQNAAAMCKDNISYGIGVSTVYAVILIRLISSARIILIHCFNSCHTTLFITPLNTEFKAASPKPALLLTMIIEGVMGQNLIVGGILHCKIQVNNIMRLSNFLQNSRKLHPITRP